MPGVGVINETCSGASAASFSFTNTSSGGLEDVWIDDGGVVTDSRAMPAGQTTPNVTVPANTAAPLSFLVTGRGGPSGEFHIVSDAHFGECVFSMTTLLFPVTH